MFDIGFSEMLVCAIVALVVIGPERLPKVARTVGHIFGRLQRYVTQVKSDINREMELAELGKVKAEFETAARSFQSEVQSQATEVEREVRELQTSLDPTDSTPQPLEDKSPQLELGIDEPAEKPAKHG